MTVEELGNLCVDYDLRITISPVLRGAQIEVLDIRSDESYFYIVNTKDIGSTITEIIGLEEDS